MSQSFPPGQESVDPRPAFAAPPPPLASGPAGWMPPRTAPWALPPPARRWLRLIAGSLLLLILLDLLGFNLLFLTALGSSASSRVRSTTIIDGNPDQTIAVIPVRGLITDESATQFDQFMTAAESDKSVKAVILAIDTPGGSASASDAMHHRLLQFKTTTKSAGRDVPVIISMGGMATSGGYYLACGGDCLFAEPITMTANIGVLMERFNVSSFLADHGIKETTIVDGNGEYKNLGSMFQPEDPKARDYLQGLTNQTFDQFRRVVMEGRRGKLPADTSAIFNGRVYMAADALKLGLIDKIGYASDAYDYAKSQANLSDARVVRYSPPSWLSRVLDADELSNIPALATRSPANGITLNGVNIDLRHLSDLIAPRPMYLWRGN